MQCIREVSSKIGLCAPKIACCQKLPVRYGRKPSWLGFAKSKLFRVPAPKNWPETEHQELYYITQHYKTYMRSLRSFQEKEYERSVEESKAHAKGISEDAELGKILEEIERDNAIVRSRREKALLVEWKQTEEDIIQQRTIFEENERQLQEVTEKELKFQMERLKSAIREDNLDEAIEKALHTIIDYNFAVDKVGNYYYGRLNSNSITPKEQIPQQPPSFST